jgi:LPS-assembly lipoprotein
MSMKRCILCALLLLTTLALSACGFQLRGSKGDQARLPFQTIYLAFPETSSLGVELKRYIRADGGTTVVQDSKAAQATVELLNESREKIIRSLNAQGRIREFSLLYKVRFRVKDSAGSELLEPTEIVLKRDISFNEQQVIAKEKEEEILYKDMQSDLVQQMLRRLGALKPAP